LKNKDVHELNKLQNFQSQKDDDDTKRVLPLGTIFQLPQLEKHLTDICSGRYAKHVVVGSM